MHFQWTNRCTCHWPGCTLLPGSSLLCGRSNGSYPCLRHATSEPRRSFSYPILTIRTSTSSPYVSHVIPQNCTSTPRSGSSPSKSCASTASLHHTYFHKELTTLPWRSFPSFGPGTTNHLPNGVQSYASGILRPAT